MHLVAGDELPELGAQPVVGIGADMVELVDGNHPAVEGGDAEAVDGEAEGCMGADQGPVVAVQKRLDGVDLAAVIAGRVAQIPFGPDGPIGPEAVSRQRFVGEAGADRPLRHHDDGLFQPLIAQLVEGDEHQGAALARGRRRLDEKVLLAALLVGELLHRPHAQLVGLRGRAGAAAGDGDERDGCIAHA